MFKNLVSLSGGLDSRAVAIALKEVDPESVQLLVLTMKEECQKMQM